MPNDDTAASVACDPEAVMARVREALPSVRRLALDAHDHRMPDSVVGPLHMAANAMEGALASWASWRLQMHARMQMARARGLDVRAGDP
jgi:hypothetical protein